MILLSLLALLASAVDVWLTLRLVREGYGEEVNPLMRWAVKRQPAWLISVVLGIRLMSTLQNYRAWRMR